MGVRPHPPLPGAGAAPQGPPRALGVVTNLARDDSRIDVGPALDVDRSLGLGPPSHLLEHLDEVGMELQLGHEPHPPQGASRRRWSAVPPPDSSEWDRPALLRWPGHGAPR